MHIPGKDDPPLSHAYSKQLLSQAAWVSTSLTLHFLPVWVGKAQQFNS